MPKDVFNHSFASDSDYIFFLGKFMNSTIYAHQLTSQCRKQNQVKWLLDQLKTFLRKLLKEFVASDNVFSFMISVKGTLSDVLIDWSLEFNKCLLKYLTEVIATLRSPLYPNLPLEIKKRQSQVFSIIIICNWSRHFSSP